MCILSYGSLKTVLQHLEANLRFVLSLHIPSIRVTEKLVPLKIETLHFKDVKVEFGENVMFAGTVHVNDTQYSISVYHDITQIPESVRIEQKFGRGFSVDFDRFGFRDHTGDDIVTPGDLNLRDPTVVRAAVPDPANNEQRIQEFELRVKIVQEKLKYLEDNGSFLRSRKRSPFNEYIKLFLNGEFEIVTANVETIKEAILHLECWIDEKTADIQPFYRRRDNQPPPYTSYLCLDIGEGRRIEVLQYQKKIHEAKKYLIGKLLGDRCDPIQIKKLMLDDDQVIQLPLGVKFNVQGMLCSGGLQKTYDALKPVLTESPLQQLVAYIENEEELELPILKHAKHLFILGNHLLIDDYWKLQNLTIRKLKENDRFMVADFVRFIKNWVELGRKAGSRVVFGQRYLNLASKLLPQLEQVYKNAVIGERSITIPTKSGKEIKVNISGAKWEIYEMNSGVLPSKDAEFFFKERFP